MAQTWDEAQGVWPEMQEAQERVLVGQSLEQDLQDLARRLDHVRADEGGTGHVRLRLWERDQGRGL